MTAPKKVLELVDLFRRNADAYLSFHYNEAQVRQEFINPLKAKTGYVTTTAHASVWFGFGRTVISTR